MAETSIRLRLLKWLISPILLINLAGGALTYMLAWLPAQIAYDQGLSDAAGALGARLSVAGGAWQIDLPPQAEQVLRSGDTDAVYFVVQDGTKPRTVAGDAGFPALRVPPKNGTPLAWDDSMGGEAVRVAVLRIDRDGRVAYVAVAKTLRKRAQIRQAIFRALVLLDSVFTVACVGLIWLSVSNGLRPLERVRNGLIARGREGGAMPGSALAGSLHLPPSMEPIAQDDIPAELAPVVHAFNGLLAKVSAGAQAQQEFLANVAHQLRTPLAGLQAQLEWLGKRHTDAETAHAVALMLQSTERMVRQSNQLLALARAEPSHFEPARLEPQALEALVQPCIQQFVEQAARKNIDLGFELEPARVLGDRFLLRDLIDNLIDNALRYTPAGGAVTVRCRQVAGQGSVLEVEDNGPGIPPALRLAVFDRHVRLDDKLTGSGLGLAIVRDISTAHGAQVAVAAGPGGVGAAFTVKFPLVP